LSAVDGDGVAESWRCARRRAAILVTDFLTRVLETGQSAGRSRHWFARSACAP